MLAQHARHAASRARLVALAPPLRLPVALLCAALLGLALRSLAAEPAPGPLYSLAALDVGLGRAPHSWLARTVRVRALLGGKCVATSGLYTQVCSSWEMALTDPEGRQDVAPLPLAWGSAPPLLAVLRRLPLLARLVPQPQIVHSSALATYRVQLQTSPCSALDDGPVCYGALLLDARQPDTTTDWVQIGS